MYKDERNPCMTLAPSKTRRTGDCTPTAMLQNFHSFAFFGKPIRKHPIRIARVRRRRRNCSLEQPSTLLFLKRIDEEKDYFRRAGYFVGS